MNINTIHFSLNNFNLKAKEAKKTHNKFHKNIELQNNPAHMAFLGGYSLDLKSIYSKMKDEEYPTGIKQMVEKEINSGNPSNKALCDIHFEKYKGVLDCYTLDDLKAKFPEFQDVRSANSIKTNKGSIVNQYQNGESEIFSYNEDLSLQLIKLYWGQGLSLTDLKEHCNDSLAYTMRSLRILLMTPRYALVLKNSNKEYNKQLSEQLSIKIKEAREAKIQKADGEPIIIPSGPLSEAHKKHISKGLLEYYENNPDAVLTQSERQKQYWANHPEEREKMSKVMNFAWHKTVEGKDVKKAVEKAIRRYNREKNANLQLNLEQIDKTENMSAEQKTFLQSFWEKNVMLRNKFSVAVKKGWIKVRKDIEEQEAKKFENKTIIATPSQVVKIINNHLAKSKIEVPSGYAPGQVLLYRKEIPAEILEQLEKLNIAVNSFLDDNEQLADKVVSIRLSVLVKLKKELQNSSSELPSKIKADPAKYKAFVSEYFNLCRKHKLTVVKGEYSNYPNTNITGNQINEFLQDYAHLLDKYDFFEMNEYLNKNLDNLYEFYVNPQAHRQDLEKLKQFFK